MASFFEPDTFLLDPTSIDDTPSSFLSFSSLSDLTNTSTSLSDYASWDYGLGSHFRGKIQTKQLSSPSSLASDSSLSADCSPRDPFSIIETAFEPTGPVGIIVESLPLKTLADGNPSSSHSIRSSTSSSCETWDEPRTPSLTNRSSVESFASTSTVGPSTFKQPVNPYSWDEASIGLGTASGYSRPAHRTTSNPVLNRQQHRVPRNVASMPALKEEEITTPSAWFDGTEQIDSAGLITSTGSASSSGQQPNVASSLQVTNELVDDFDWVFGDYGLGIADNQENSIFAPFPSDDLIIGSTSTDHKQDIIDSYVAQSQQQQQLDPESWLPTPVVQDTAEFTYDFSAIANLPNFTVDPMSIMGSYVNEEEPSRPSSAPGYNGGESSGNMLNVPMADTMMRSVSSDGLTFPRQAAPRDLFSYAPQAIPAGPPAPQPLYTTEPSQSYTHFSRTMPPTPSHGSHGRRASVNGLTIQIQPLQYSTYNPSFLPPTPQSATFGDFSSQQNHQPIQMTRAGTQPLPTTRRLSTSEPKGNTKMPAHLVRAQAIVQMQEAKEEAQRQEMRRLSASKRVGMAQASVMQPQYRPQPQYQPQPIPQYSHIHPPPQRQTIMGWEGPSAQTATLPVLTTTPLVTIHPPPQYIVQQDKNGLKTPLKIHPPPHPGVNRPMAKLPVSPSRQRKVSASPKGKSPATKKRQAQNAGGGFSWGETTFINFTSDDAEKLLTGVAPSGSQGKRKREEGMMQMGLEDGIEMSRDGSKRSRGNEVI